jgi:hypothetical protein
VSNGLYENQSCTVFTQNRYLHADCSTLLLAKNLYDSFNFGFFGYGHKVFKITITAVFDSFQQARFLRSAAKALLS